MIPFLHPMPQRTDQVASVIRRAVQAVLSKGLNDPRVRGLLSVTRVEVSDDLARAAVLVSVLPAEQADLTLHGLQHAARHIQIRVREMVRMRRMPRLVFRLDESIKREAGIYSAITEARRSDRQRAGSRPQESEA